MDTRALYEKMVKQTVYFFNDFEKVVIRSEPNGKDYVKFKGREEFLANEGNKLVADTIAEPREVTKEFYNNY